MAFISFQPKDHFNTKIYTGNSGTQALTGVGFQPDLVWIKNRNDSNNQSNVLYDSVRGVTKYLSSNSNAVEGTEAAGVTAFGTDGFTVGNTVTVNTGFNYVAWNWKAGGAASSNSNGSITSSVSANTTAGISIVAYTGTGSAGATVGHGLGVKPSLIIEKGRAGVTDDWLIYHQSYGATDGFALNNQTGATDSDSYWNDVEPTSTVFTIGNNGKVNTNTATHIAFCFAEKSGYSKFGDFYGNGNANGAFVFCGFRPAWVMMKRADGGSEDWRICDNKRDPENVMDRVLFANLSNVESDADVLDFLSNGFKLRTTDGGMNASGGRYIYMAFAEHPLVASNGDPATAR